LNLQVQFLKQKEAMAEKLLVGELHTECSVSIWIVCGCDVTTANIFTPKTLTFSESSPLRKVFWGRG